MIRWQLNKLEHTRMLLDKNLITLSAEINLCDPLTSQYNWSDLLKVAIDKLVEVGKEHKEVFFPHIVPVSLREPYLKRQGVVVKFDYDGRGNVYWIRHAPNTFATTKQKAAQIKVAVVEDSEEEEGSEEEVEAAESAEEETPAAAVEVTDGPILVHQLPGMKQWCPSQSGHTRYRDSFATLLDQAKAEKVFTRPNTVIV